MKNRKIPGEVNINSELYKCAPESFKLRLLKFLNNIRLKNCIRNVMISNTEDNLQKAVYKLNQIIIERFNYICTENKAGGIYRRRSS
jgi:hypothetical protein